MFFFRNFLLLKPPNSSIISDCEGRDKARCWTWDAEKSRNSSKKISRAQNFPHKLFNSNHPQNYFYLFLCHSSNSSKTLIFQFKRGFRKLETISLFIISFRFLVSFLFHANFEILLVCFLGCTTISPNSACEYEKYHQSSA